MNKEFEYEYNYNKELNKYLDEGWNKGFIRNNQNYGGDIWINNGKINTKIKKDKLDIYLNKGYSIGRINYRRTKEDIIKRIWVNNSYENKKIDINELDKYINLGYLKGRCNYKRNEK